MAYSASPIAHLAADLSGGASTSAIDTTGADLIVVSQSFFNNAATLADNKSNTWHLVAQYDFFGVPTIKVYYALNPTVGSGHTFQAGTNPCAYALAAWSGSDLTAPEDGHNGAFDTSTATIATGSLTPSVANCLVVTGLYYESDTVSSVNAGFTLIDSVVGGSGAALAYQIQTAATPLSPTWTLSGSQARIGAAIASFKAAAGGGGGGTTVRAIGLLGVG